MKQKTISILIALIIAIVFLFFAIRPGIFNMLGYSISILIFPENSSENLKYGNLITYGFDIVCALVLFLIVYKVAKRVR